MRAERQSPADSSSSLTPRARGTPRTRASSTAQSSSTLEPHSPERTPTGERVTRSSARHSSAVQQKQDYVPPRFDELDYIVLGIFIWSIAWIEAGYWMIGTPQLIDPERKFAKIASLLLIASTAASFYMSFYSLLLAVNPNDMNLCSIQNLLKSFIRAGFMACFTFGLFFSLKR